MILPYILRLLCLCLGSFFLIHLALSLVTSAVGPWAMRRAEGIAMRRPAHSAAMLLLALRLFPAVLSIAAVTALCVPSFLSFEGQRGPEATGIPFLAVAALGASIWAISLTRSVRALIRSHHQVPRRSAIVGRESERVWLLDSGAPLIGLVGVLRPRVLVSRSVATALEGDQLAAALRHERAHRASADNLKRLLLLLAPEALPGLSLFRSVDRAWVRLAEWAADDWAASDAPSSIALAEALVRVARLGASPRTSPLVSAFVPAGEDISVRVNRLLNGACYAGGHSRVFGSAALFTSLFAVPFTVVAVAPGSLSAVHQLLERLMH